MPSERRRHQLYEDVKSVVGPDSADELMSYLPPVGWADVATKADLGLIRSEMDALRAEVRGEMAGLRGEMDALRAEMRGEIAEMRGEMAGLRGEMTGLRADFRAEMHQGFASMQRWMVTTMIATTGLFSAAVVAAVQLGR